MVDFQDFRSHVQREYFPRATPLPSQRPLIRFHDRFPSQRAKHDDISVLRRHRRVLFDVPDDDDVSGVFQVRPFRERAVVIQRSRFRWRGDWRFASRRPRRTPPPVTEGFVAMMVLVTTTTQSMMMMMMDALQSEV